MSTGVTSGARTMFSGRSGPVLRETIAAAALGNERVICAVRSAFFAALTMRHLLVTEQPPGPALLTGAPYLLGIAFSVGVLVSVRRPPHGHALWVLSVLIDALVCSFTLLPSALWPTPDYVGVIDTPDTAGFLVVTVAAGLRLSPRAALAGGAASVAGFLGLVSVDEVVSGARFDTSLGHASMYLIYIAACATLAGILTALTRRLLVRGSAAALRAERAEEGLWALLADHHDLRSLLTAATISAETLSAALERDDQAADPAPATDRPRLRATAAELRDDLRRLGAIVRAVRGKTLDNLEPERLPAAVDVTAAVADVVAAARRRHPAVAFRVAEGGGPAAALVAGGATSLARMLRNLLDNAAEGDGRRAATQVDVAVQVDPGARTVRIDVADDGPGIPAAVLAGAPERVRSTKPDGSGLGLSATRGLAEASGGRLALANRLAGGGAVASVTLPLAPESRP